MEGKRFGEILEWRVKNVGFVSVAFGGFLFLGCISAYLVAVARGNVHAILPLISDAAGSPPQNGLFGGFICLGGIFGVAFMILRYLIVWEKNSSKSSLVSALNILSLSCGIASMLALTLVTGYPINFYRNRDIWLSVVGYPHLIGGVSLLSLGLMYIGVQCILTLLLNNKITLLIRLLLLCVCSATFLYHMVSVPHHFKGISDKYYFNNTERTRLKNTDLLPASLPQWLFVFCLCCFFFTYFREMQDYTFDFVLNTPSPSDGIEDRKAEIRRLSLAIQSTGLVNTKTAPEVRKYLRRDSTCQTMIEDEKNDTIKNVNGASEYHSR